MYHKVRWNDLSIQTSKVQPLKFKDEEVILTHI